MKAKNARERLLSELELETGFSTIGAFLRAKRLELSMTQIEVAKRAGISYQTLSNIEIGRSLPRQRTLDRLKEALGNLDIPSDLIPWSVFENNKGVPKSTKKRTNALGKYVTKRRIELDLTQEHLAKRLGVCRVVIARVETGTYNCGKSFLKKLATALECEFPPEFFRS